MPNDTDRDRNGALSAAEALRLLEEAKLAGSEGGRRGPPVEHRFKPGRSGNPGGRPPKKIPLMTAVNEALLELGVKNVEVTGPDGEIRKVSLIDLSIHRLASKAASGDVWAMKILYEIIRHQHERGIGEDCPSYIEDLLKGQF